MADDKDIEFLEPMAQVLMVDGQSIIITPLTVGELPRVVRAVEPLLGTLIYEAENLDAPHLVALLGTHGEALLEAVALCARRELEWVSKLLPDRLVALALACVEVNGDFFIRALAAAKDQAPRIAPTLAARIMANPATALVGRMPSTG